MKKFAAFITLMVLVLGGYLFATGRVQISCDTGTIAGGAMAETVSHKDETALEGMKRIDSQLWNAIKDGNEETAVSILTAAGWPEGDSREYARSKKADAKALSQRYVHIVAEKDDVCFGEAVHYLVTGTNKNWNESNSSYNFCLKKVNGRWEPAVLNDEEAEKLNQVYYGLFKPEAVEAALAGRNMAQFGNYLWTEPDGVEQGAYIAEMAYMYQEEKGDVILVVKLANGKNEIVKMNSISVRIKDSKLGQIVNVKEKCNVSILPGTVELYEIRIKANKMKKGTWTNLDAHIDTKY